jgi:hypothetical protein
MKQGFYDGKQIKEVLKDYWDEDIYILFGDDRIFKPVIENSIAYFPKVQVDTFKLWLDKLREKLHRENTKPIITKEDYDKALEVLKIAKEIVASVSKNKDDSKAKSEEWKEKKKKKILQVLAERKEMTKGTLQTACAVSSVELDTLLEELQNENLIEIEEYQWLGRKATKVKLL